MGKSKFLRTLLLAVVIVGGIWALVNRDRIGRPEDALALLKYQIGSLFPPSNSSPAYPQQDISVPNQGADFIPSQSASYPSGAAQMPTYSQSVPNQPAAAVAPFGTQLVANPRTGGVIRLAVFKLNERAPYLKSDEPVQLLAEICRQYDIIALQNISRNDTTWIKRVTDLMNQLGSVGTQHQLAAGNARRSDYVAISDRSRRNGQTQTVMIFNRQTIQLDHSKWYVVDDPDRIFKHDPMVAWFRCQGAPAQEAFTFTLACLEIDSKRPDKELQQIGTLLRAIRTDGRGEDDVILAGDFQADDRGLDAIRNQAGLTWVLSNHFTNVQRDRQYDNIVFSEAPTNEFTGRGGAIDFMQKYRLRPEDASAVAEHLPIWAEFSIYENGQVGQQQIPGRIAARLNEQPSADR